MNKIKIPLFRNKRKKNDKQPDYTFSFKDMNDDWKSVASAWVNKTKAGEKYLSVVIDEDNMLSYIEKEGYIPNKEEEEERIEGIFDGME